MYRKPSKRKQLIQRIIVYGAMVVSVGVLVTVLVFIMLGYQFNRNDGKIEQGGLVQFESQPAGADITIDGTAFGTRTSTKTTMTTGEHFVTMEKPGYKKWQKSIEVMPGSVLWLNYSRLIPNEVKPVNVADLPGITSSAASPDDKFMAIVEVAASPIVRLADVSGDSVKLSSIELPTTSYTHPAADKTQTFSIDIWDPSSRYVLLKHVYDDVKIEWIILDTRDRANTKNITTLLGIDASKVVFSGTSGQIAFAQIGHEIRKIDLGSATLSRPLLSNVAEFSLFNQTTIVYTTLVDPSTKTRGVGYLEDGAEKAHSVRSYTDDGSLPLHATMGKYFNEQYMAIAYGTDVQIIKGDALRNSEKSTNLITLTAMTTPGNVSFLSSKTSGRFVITQEKSTYSVYDLELKKLTTTTVKNAAELPKELEWLDGYMLWSDSGGTLRFYEFDGANQHDIMPVLPGFTAMLSPDGKYVYGIVKSANETLHLQRAQLIL